MFLIDLESADPFFNLAVDEFLLKNRTGDFIIISVNDRSVITGKHQVAHREINTRFAFEHSIPLIRRISGGGTVFHDPGNINFSFILNSSEGMQIDFRKYTLPVIAFLENLGITAVFEGKNDLKVDGLKISGNAEHVSGKRVLHHGTLLFNASMEIMHEVLRKDNSAYITRAVSSNPSKVINLNKLIGTPVLSSAVEFRSRLKDWFLTNKVAHCEYLLSATEISDIKALAESRYMTWEWNYAYGPEYVFRKRLKAFGSDAFCTLKVKDGIIASCVAEGQEKFRRITDKLPGCRHMPEDILEIFGRESVINHEIDIFDFF